MALLIAMSNTIKMTDVYKLFFNFNFIVHLSAHSRLLLPYELTDVHTVYRFYFLNNEYIRPRHLYRQNNHNPIHNLKFFHDLIRYVHFPLNKQVSRIPEGLAQSYRFHDTLHVFVRLTLNRRIVMYEEFPQQLILLVRLDEILRQHVFLPIIPPFEKV